MLRRSGLLVLLLSLAPPPVPVGPAFSGVSPVAAQEAPPDPGAPGPYAVGATRRTFTRASSTTGQPRVLDAAIWYPATSASAALPTDRRDERYAPLLDPALTGGDPDIQITFAPAGS